MVAQVRPVVVSVPGGRVIGIYPFGSLPTRQFRSTFSADLEWHHYVNELRRVSR
jgi:hypothetical protein